MQDNNVNILFPFQNDIFDEEMVETVWAAFVDMNNGLYTLDNIPFYAPLVASDDIIFAEFDEQQQMIRLK